MIDHEVNLDSITRQGISVKALLDDEKMQLV